jgi:hypothetical protein
VERIGQCRALQSRSSRPRRSRTSTWDWPRILDEQTRRAVELAELEIDGRLAAEERLAAARGAAQALAEASAKLDIRSNGHLYHAALAAALCLHTDGVPLRARVDDPSIAGPFDCAMFVAVNCAYANAIYRVHPIDSKAQKHAQLAIETDAEYAEQCHVLRGIFGYPFALSEFARRTFTKT